MNAKRITAALLLLLTLSGCSARTEVRNKSFIRFVGIESGDEVTAAVSLYDSDEKLEGKGETLFAAIADSERSQGKSLFSGHMELFISNPQNIYENLKTLIHNNRISPSCSVICTAEGADRLVMKSDGSDISDMLESSSRGGLVIKKNISSVLDDMMGADGKACVPVIKDGDIFMGVISRNRLLGTLNSDESRGLCWLGHKIEDIYIPVTVNSKVVNFYVRKSTPKITAEKSGDSINITAEIKINGNPEEMQTDTAAVKDSLARQISGICAKTIAKTVTGMKADVFGIEKSMNARGMSVGNWEEIIPHLNFSYKIKISE